MLDDMDITTMRRVGGQKNVLFHAVEPEGGTEMIRYEQEELRLKEALSKQWK